MAENEPDGLLAFERALGLESMAGETPDERLARETLERSLAPLASLLAPIAPSDDLFARITAKAGVDTPFAGIHVVRHDSGTWKSIAAGIDVKTLWRSPQGRRRTYVLRMHAGAILPMHDHDGDEELFLLEGDMQVNGVAFGPGDFQVAFAGTRHPIVTTLGGCLCYISVAQ